MVDIPGGTFTMGRNGGNDNERPEHQVTVKNFSMDTNEVTNAQYLEFVQATGYRPFPVHWVNEKADSRSRADAGPICERR
jgi:formylglycine-generating enzyme required for sulfatase activity